MPLPSTPGKIMGHYFGNLIEEKRFIQDDYNLIYDYWRSTWTEKRPRRDSIYVDPEIWQGYTDDEILDAFAELENKS